MQKGRYIKLKRNGKSVDEHRWVWEQANGKIPKGMTIHHINSNGHDNRLENLALVTHQQNMQKSDKMGRGWTFIKNKAYNNYKSARIVNGINTYLGYFGTPCGAMMAYNTAYIT